MPGEMTAPTKLPAFDADAEARAIIAAWHGAELLRYQPPTSWYAALANDLRAAFAAGQQATPPAQSDAERERLIAALRPFAALLDRRWTDKDENISVVERGGRVSELHAIDLGDVLRARAAIAKTTGAKP